MICGQKSYYSFKNNQNWNPEEVTAHLDSNRKIKGKNKPKMVKDGQKWSNFKAVNKGPLSVSIRTFSPLNIVKL